jgi:hypothetical protein
VVEGLEYGEVDVFRDLFSLKVDKISDMLNFNFPYSHYIRDTFSRILTFTPYSNILSSNTSCIFAPLNYPASSAMMLLGEAQPVTYNLLAENVVYSAGVTSNSLNVLTLTLYTLLTYVDYRKFPYFKPAPSTTHSSFAK